MDIIKKVARAVCVGAIAAALRVAILWFWGAVLWFIYSGFVHPFCN